MTDRQAERERLRKAIDNMEKTDVCLDIFDRAIKATEAAVLERAAEEVLFHAYARDFANWARQQAKELQS